MSLQNVQMSLRYMAICLLGLVTVVREYGALCPTELKQVARVFFDHTRSLGAVTLGQSEGQDQMRGFVMVPRSTAPSAENVWRQQIDGFREDFHSGFSTLKCRRPRPACVSDFGVSASSLSA